MNVDGTILSFYIFISMKILREKFSRNSSTRSPPDVTGGAEGRERRKGRPFRVPLGRFRPSGDRTPLGRACPCENSRIRVRYSSRGAAPSVPRSPLLGRHARSPRLLQKPTFSRQRSQCRAPFSSGGALRQPTNSSPRNFSPLTGIVLFLPRSSKFYITISHLFIYLYCISGFAIS